MKSQLMTTTSIPHPGSHFDPKSADEKLSITRISESGFEPLAEVKLIPRGAFAGTIYEVGLVRDGRVVIANTGDQGGGQS
jgi:hypothetical protein